MDFSGDWTPGAMFAAGVAMVTFLLLRRWLRYQRRVRPSARRAVDRSKRPSRSVRSPGDGRREPLLDAPPEVLRWQVEMHDVARDLKGELDSKMVALQTLIAMARTESERLEKLLQASPSSRNEDLLDSIAEMERLADITLPQGPSPGSTDAERRCAQIYALTDQGLTPAAVAEQLGLAIGDVELMLSVR